MSMLKQRSSLLICLTVGSLIFGGIAYGANIVEGSDVTVTVKKNQSIRDISGEYLQDPDLWMDILRANNLSSAEAIRPGMTLHIPTNAIFKARNELETSLSLIQAATAAGAKLFAPGRIAEAIQLRNDALKKRRAGAWSECAVLASSAAREAEKALTISKANHDVPAEAVVEYCSGEVQSRTPSEDLWKDASRYDILIEGDKIRTLSQSYAEILFKDDSRLQLKENAQALIQKMRTNRLEEAQEANVSLIEGDVLALLAGGGGQGGFRLDVPGVETDIRSQRFWVSRDDRGARFANYDGELKIAAAGGEVLLRENQGSLVPRNEKPTGARQLLDGPNLLGPDEGDEVFHGKTGLRWSEVEGAEHYLVEFARDGTFSTILGNTLVKGTSTALPQGVGYGAFYWRVIAFSSDGLPGRNSQARVFVVRGDDVPPFLTIRTPKEGAVVFENSVIVSGNTEEEATVTGGKKPVAVIGEGDFMFRQALTEGENRIAVRAADRAGNVTEVVRTVYYVPEEAMELTFGSSLHQIDPSHFVVGTRSFSLSGKTVPQAVVTFTRASDHLEAVYSGQRRAAGAGSPEGLPAVAVTIADDAGRFQSTLQILGEKDRFGITVLSRTGMGRHESFSVELDENPPIINLVEEIPAATGTGVLFVAGMIERGSSLTLNGEAVALAEVETSKLTAFRVPITLTAGVNRLQLEARDQVGNVAAFEKEVLYDSEAPTLEEYVVSLPEARGGEDVHVAVRARDATGFVKVASFTLWIGDASLAGYMVLSDPEGGYTGLIRVPKNVSGTIKFNSITLSDYLGNKREYLLN
ncbi:MAG: FecR domain-containing protein [Deltaproteobacteria bacterium]|nr:FecR domain-containing protein [Deltaproteobacteria bacterium]